jgi:PAS domain S-box-containing protein
VPQAITYCSRLLREYCKKGLKLSASVPNPPQWTESSSAADTSLCDNQSMFRLLFERSADAILLMDPRRNVFVDCNQAAIEMMRASSREQLLVAGPPDLSPEFQPDGKTSREKSPEMTEIALAKGSHRFEWVGRRFDGTDIPLEILVTPIQTGETPLIAAICRDISARKEAERSLRESEARFRSLFEHSADALSIFDPETGRFVESNDAVARLVGAPNKEALGNASPVEISPLRQPDGQLSSEKVVAMTNLALQNGSHRFEWLALRSDGAELPLDIVLTRVPFGNRKLLFVAARDISTQKSAETEILRLNTSLEQRVAERTVALVQTNDQLKTEIGERRRQENIQKKRNEQVRKHRDVLLELAQFDKSDLNRTLEKICSLAAFTLNVARVSYWWLQDEATAIVREFLFLEDKVSFDRSHGVRLTAAACPAYFRALAGKRPIVADNAFTDAATSELMDSYLGPLGITSMLDSPVWVRGEVVGVLCHEHIGPARRWSAEEIDFVSALASMASLAIEESNRVRSERTLRESEAKFRALFEGTSQGVILHDEHRILEVNSACVRILGFNGPDEIIGKHPAETSAPIQSNGEPSEVLARQYIQDCMTRGSARFDWITRSPQGKDTPIEVILTRVQLGGRQLIQAVINDISERKRAETELRASEARLRESEKRFSSAFRASPVLIAISRLSDGKFIEVNDAFIRWMGLSQKEIIGHTSVELGIWQEAETRARFLDQLLATGSVRDVEHQLRSHGGVPHTMLVSAEIIEINGERHILTFGLDITQRKQAESELLKTLAREKELGQLRSKFVSMVSHEFRTPLGIIQSSAEILDDYLDQLEPEERKEQLQSIQRNTKRMAGMMEEVLLIGSFDAGRMEFKPEPVEIRAFAERLVDELLSVTDHRCPIELSLVELPKEAQLDERLVRHIFSNLLTNASKYSEAGCMIHFEMRRDGQDLVCSVHDKGIGIPETDREWLFQAFHRGQNVGDIAGTGLGLVIVKRCVDLHGGRIKIDSKPGQGTTVMVRIPAFSE